ncbi:MAG: polyprenyl synthetase family protein [Dehalococcoidia bacterium]|nr:polyprenyl synthetase family protein [Dehalococcoidia bacterium]
MTATEPHFALIVRAQMESVERLIRGVADQALAQGISPLLAKAVEVPGKRLRPTLTILASRFGRGSEDTVVLMASGVELLHLATLLHDDAVDAAATRRGRATLNAIWGPNAAVLVGDYLFSASAIQVADTGNLRIMRRFAQTIMELSTGQLLEQVQAYKPVISREQYYQRIAAKTASLFSTAVESGAVLAELDEGRVQALVRYGRNLGMAFQVIDDILDFEGVPEEMGKPVGEDLAHGVLTLPAIMLLERYPKDNPIVSFYKEPGRTEALQQAVAMVRESGIIQDAYQVAAAFCDEALQGLGALPHIPERETMEEIAQYVVRRRK